MTIIVIVALSIAAAIAVWLLAASRKSGDFHIERSTQIAAPVESIFPRISDLRRFNEWNPFALADPGCSIQYEGPPHGPGAAYDWDSKGRAGKGRMEVLEETASQQVHMRLRFERPMPATNHVVFTMQPEGGGSRVTWTMTGRNGPLLVRAMCMLFNMDKMVGGEFAKGLATLKSQVEDARSNPGVNP